MTLVPEEWRLLRGLLRIVGLATLAIITVAALEAPLWARGPLPVAVALYLVSPLAVVAGAIVVRRRWPGARGASNLVGAIAAVAFAGNLGLVIMVHHLVHGSDRVLGRSCRTLSKCEALAADKFGTDHPEMPSVPSVAGYSFQGGWESGRLLALTYGPPDDDRSSVVFVVAQRRPDGPEPPTDPSGLLTTPGARTYAERGDGDRVSWVDWWDGAFHYAVSLQGSFDRSAVQYQRALALIDSARRF